MSTNINHLRRWMGPCVASAPSHSSPSQPADCATDVLTLTRRHHLCWEAEVNEPPSSLVFPEYESFPCLTSHSLHIPSCSWGMRRSLCHYSPWHEGVVQLGKKSESEWDPESLLGTESLISFAFFYFTNEKEKHSLLFKMKLQIEICVECDLVHTMVLKIKNI